MPFLLVTTFLKILLSLSLVSLEIIFFGFSIFLSLIKLGVINLPPLLIAPYKAVACKGVVVIP